MGQARVLKMVVALLATLLLLPLVAIMFQAAQVDSAALDHLVKNQLFDYIFNSVSLAIITAILALIMGVGTAWSVAMYRFPGRATLQWLLMMPLAVPAYLSAIAYADLFDNAGMVQSQLRAITGQTELTWFPEIRSLGGAAFVLACALYPYVYILARLAFGSQCRQWFENAQLLGVPSKHWLMTIALPLARPACVVACALVMMEVLADFGTVQVMGVSTFTTGIYRAWLGLGDMPLAAALACVLLIMVSGSLIIERTQRRHHFLQLRDDKQGAIWSLPESRARGWLRLVLCSIPVMLGFGIPVLQLLYWALSQRFAGDVQHWQALGTSLTVASLTALLALLVALIFAYAVQWWNAPWLRGLVRLATMGYAIPGSVIAVGIFVPLLRLDQTIADVMENIQGTRPPLWITASIAAMVIACVIRFLAVAYGGVSSAMERFNQQADDAARLLGQSRIGVIRTLHLPQLKTPLVMCGLMVFADTLKELPASMLLRPFDVNTLAIRSYELMSDGRLSDGAIPALMLIAISMVAVCVLAWHSIAKGTTS